MKCPTCTNETWDSPCPQCGHFLVPRLADVQQALSYADMVGDEPIQRYIRQLEAEVVLLRREAGMDKGTWNPRLLDGNRPR